MFPTKGSYEGQPIVDVKHYKAYIGPATPFSNQQIDIVIVYHGQYEKVAGLMRSLIYKTRSNPFRVCLVDDGSPNKDFLFDGFDDFVNVKQVQNQQQIGFVPSLFEGLRALTYEPNGLSPWLLFLSHDAVITDTNWLLHLGQGLIELKGTKQVKMVSPCTNNGAAPKFMQATQAHASNYILSPGEHLPIFCTLCHKELFSKLGGFFNDPKELAERMQGRGYFQAVIGKSFVGCAEKSSP